MYSDTEAALHNAASYVGMDPNMAFELKPEGTVNGPNGQDLILFRLTEEDRSVEVGIDEKECGVEVFLVDSCGGLERI